MDKAQIIYLASQNQGKVREFNHLLAGIAQVKDLQGFDLSWEETGETFCENALIKARVVRAAVGGEAVLADDSGLCVAALNGAPGIYSARWAGEGADDQANIQKLLLELQGIPESKRQAEFTCCLAFIDRDGLEQCFTAHLAGHISLAPQGVGGFGYDPVFIPTGSKLSLADLSFAEKNLMSHRRKAIEKFRQFLLNS